MVGYHAGEQVDLVVFGGGDHQIAFAHVLIFEHGDGRLRRTVDDRGMSEAGSQLLPLLLIGLEDLYVVAAFGFVQHFRKVISHQAAAEDDDVMGIAGSDVQIILHLAHVVHRRQQQHVVAGAEPVAAAGDDQLALMLDAHDDAGHGAAQFGQGSVQAGAAFRQPQLDHGQLPAAQIGNVVGLGIADKLGYFLGGDLFRIDQHVDAQGGEGVAVVQVAVAGRAHPGHRAFDPGPVGQEAGDQIEFVLIGDGNDQVRISYIRLSQGLQLGGVAVDGVDVEMLLHQIQPGAVLVDDGDVMALLAQVGGQGKAHFASADDDRFHVYLPLQARCVADVTVCIRILLNIIANAQNKSKKYLFCG